MRAALLAILLASVMLIAAVAESYACTRGMTCTTYRNQTFCSCNP